MFQKVVIRHCVWCRSSGAQSTGADLFGDSKEAIALMGKIACHCSFVTVSCRVCLSAIASGGGKRSALLNGASVLIASW